MKKFFNYLLTILIVLICGCSSSSSDVYDESKTNDINEETKNVSIENDAKSFYIDLLGYNLSYVNDIANYENKLFRTEDNEKLKFIDELEENGDKYSVELSLYNGFAENVVFSSKYKYANDESISNAISKFCELGKVFDKEYKTQESAFDGSDCEYYDSYDFSSDTNINNMYTRISEIFNSNYSIEDFLSANDFYRWRVSWKSTSKDICPNISLYLDIDESNNYETVVSMSFIANDIVDLIVTKSIISSGAINKDWSLEKIKYFLGLSKQNSYEKVGFCLRDFIFGLTNEEDLGKLFNNKIARLEYSEKVLSYDSYTFISSINNLPGVLILLDNRRKVVGIYIRYTNQDKSYEERMLMNSFATIYQDYAKAIGYINKKENSTLLWNNNNGSASSSFFGDDLLFVIYPDGETDPEGELK